MDTSTVACTWGCIQQVLLLSLWMSEMTTTLSTKAVSVNGIIEPEMTFSQSTVALSVSGIIVKEMTSSQVLLLSL